MGEQNTQGGCEQKGVISMIDNTKGLQPAQLTRRPWCLVPCLAGLPHV